MTVLDTAVVELLDLSGGQKFVKVADVTMNTNNEQGLTLTASSCNTVCSGVRRWLNPRMSHLELIAIVVDDYDPAIAFFVDVLGFELVEDSPSTTNDGRPKRWVVVRPPHAQTGILLARADGPAQRAIVGSQHAGRVGWFLRVDDFDAAYSRLQRAGVKLLSTPRDEPYGRVVVFKDIAGNRWDLLGR